LGKEFSRLALKAAAAAWKFDDTEAENRRRPGMEINGLLVRRGKKPPGRIRKPKGGRSKDAFNQP